MGEPHNPSIAPEPTPCLPSQSHNIGKSVMKSLWRFAAYSCQSLDEASPKAAIIAILANFTHRAVKV
jgi:hypothetical protein